MKILRLELHGFKSFKEKTIIQFNQPITAIVGSNGCGKSNVVDALYWVMGDMSPKHLRGASMTDVIFSGTKTTHALDVAEVTLVLERDPDKDPALPPQFQNMNEVQITRRYYRHGESEYFINRISCRLRDIQEFFMDTGIGAKSYSIIEQGAITRMVAQKPEERRLVIEDVAGITKFKARRAETERKLEQSKLNLQRVDDLVADLKKQLNSLQRQAEKAQKFKEWSDELRDLEIRVAGTEWVARRDRLIKSKDDSVIASTKLTDLEASLEKGREELLSLRESFESSEQELGTLRSSRQEQEIKVKEVEGQIQALASKEETLQKRKESDERVQDELQRRGVELAETLERLSLSLAETEVDASKHSLNIEELRSVIDGIRNDFESLRVEVEGYRKELHTHDLSMTKISQEIQGDQKQTLQLEDRQSTISEVRQEIEREFMVKTQEKSGAERLLVEAFAERKDLEAQKESIDAQIQSYDVELTAQTEKLLKGQEELTRQKLRLSHLQELEKNLEGIGSASRSLALYLKDQKGNMAPMIADQIKVPQLLERAVESALGDSLETIVVNQYSEVQELLNYLKGSSDLEAKSARVRFFVRDALPKIEETAPAYFSNTPGAFTPPAENPGPDNVHAFAAQSELVKPSMTIDRYLREHPAVVGNMNELLSQGGQVAEWASLYSNWWVVRDRSAFETLRPSIDENVTLVSLDGDVSHPNGFLDYSPVEDNPEYGRHLVQRRRELEELKQSSELKAQEVAAVQVTVEELKRSLGAEKEAYKLLTQRLVALNPGLQKHTDLIRELEAQVARLGEKKENLSREFELNSEKLEDLKVQLEERNSLLIEKTELRKTCEESLLDAQAKLSEVELRIKEKSTELESAQKLYNEVLKQLTSQKTEQASLLQEKNLSASRLAQLEADFKEVSAQLDVIQVSREELAKSRTDFSEKFTHFQAEEIRVDALVREQRKNVSTKEADVSRFQNDLQKEFERLKNLEQDSAVNEVEIRNIEDRLASQYQIKLSELPEEELARLMAPSDLEENLNPELNREKIERLRGKIDRLGKINMVAMEEYQDLAQRYEYLYVQRQDLSDAINSLFEAISRIDTESKDRFKESFDAVNKAFQDTFPIMFGGGVAELKLTNPDNLLESGVEIVAQPPGKKLQSVTLLSGGEKALTAVSLIFGIFSIKPSPFAVLDEVDAPLDDTNVGRFNNQVRRMAEASQIIMITHHKKSMESADAMYGVTMEEPGISKIASAKLGRI
ncbi:MAG: AAA family ATPase [Bdellovibrionota bacterium]